MNKLLDVKKNMYFKKNLGDGNLIRKCVFLVFLPIFPTMSYIVILLSNLKACFSRNQSKVHYRISSNKPRASNKRHPLISTATLGIHIEISASPLISAAPLNTALIRIVTILY